MGHLISLWGCFVFAVGIIFMLKFNVVIGLFIMVIGGSMINFGEKSKKDGSEKSEG